MTILAFIAVGVIIFLYCWVWSTPKEQDLPPEDPVIDRLWRVFDREQGGYIIFVERVE